MSIYKKPTGIWHYDFQYRGSRFHGSTGQRDKRLAKAVEDQIKDNARLAGQIHNNPDPTILEATALYFAHKGQFEQNSKTTKTYLSWIVRDIGRNRRLSEITESELHTIIAKRRKRKVRRDEKVEESFYANSTVNRQFTELLRRVWRHVAPKSEQPNWTSLLLREASGRIRALPAGAELLVRKHLRPDCLPLVAWLLDTGMRISEAAKLEWSDIDYYSEEVTVRGKREAGSDGEKLAVIPLTNNGKAILEACRGHHERFVFTFEQQRSSHGRQAGDRIPVKRRYALDLVQQAYKKAGLEGYGLHDLRHTAALRLLMDTGNLVFVQALLRHNDITTTRRYTQVQTSDLREAMNARSPDIVPTFSVEDVKKRNKTKG